MSCIKILARKLSYSAAPRFPNSLSMEATTVPSRTEGNFIKTSLLFSSFGIASFAVGDYNKGGIHNRKAAPIVYPEAPPPSGGVQEACAAQDELEDIARYLICMSV